MPPGGIRTRNPQERQQTIALNRAVPGPADLVSHTHKTEHRITLMRVFTVIFGKREAYGQNGTRHTMNLICS
jgi:hypothetical protein